MLSINYDQPLVSDFAWFPWSAPSSPQSGQSELWADPGGQWTRIISKYTMQNIIKVIMQGGIPIGWTLHDLKLKASLTCSRFMSSTPSPTWDWFVVSSREILMRSLTNDQGFLMTKKVVFAQCCCKSVIVPYLMLRFPPRSLMLPVSKR